MSEPITDKEIQEYREKVRDRLEKRQGIKNVLFLVMVFVLLLTIVSCIVITLKWFTIALVGSLYLLNYIIIKFLN